MIWVAVLVASLGCYLLKVVGLAVPPRWVEGERTTRIATLLPVALLAALVVVQTVGGAHRTVVVDARLAGVGAAVLAVLLRAPFLLVVFLAASTAALVRLVS